MGEAPARRVTPHVGLALALITSNGVVLSCFRNPDENALRGDLTLGYARTLLDAGEGSGIDPDAGVIVRVPEAQDASLDELLDATCEETCRRFDHRRKLESCEAPKSSESLYPQQDATFRTSIYTVNCMFEPLTLPNGCVPFGE